LLFTGTQLLNYFTATEPRDRIPPFPLMRGHNISFGQIPSIEQSKKDVLVTENLIYFYNFLWSFWEMRSFVQRQLYISVNGKFYTFALLNMLNSARAMVPLHRVFLLLI
jgi:hypothetical protein